MIAVWLYVFSILFCSICSVFFFKQKTAYEMRISDWSSDVCSSDLVENLAGDVVSNGARCIGVGQVVGRRFVVDGKLAGGNFAGESAREGVGAGEAGIMFCEVGEVIEAGHDEISCSPLRKLDKHRSGH